MAIQFISFGEAILKRIAGFRSSRLATIIKMWQAMLISEGIWNQCFCFLAIYGEGLVF